MYKAANVMNIIYTEKLQITETKLQKKNTNNSANNSINILYLIM